jgi:hypothetical protein
LHALERDWLKFVDTGNAGSNFAYENNSRDYAMRFARIVQHENKYTDIKLVLCQSTRTEQDTDDIAIPSPSFSIETYTTKGKETEKDVTNDEKQVERLVHRCILWARSAHFRAMLSSGFTEACVVF